MTQNMEQSKKPNIIYPKVSFLETMGFLWRGIGKNKTYLFLTIFLLGFASVGSIITPIYYKKFFDILSSGADKATLVPSLIHQIFIILIIQTTAWLSWRIGSLTNVAFQANSMANLRRQAYGIMMRHSYGFFANNFTGSLVQRVGRYARAFERMSDRFTWDVVQLTVRLVGIFIVTYSINPKLTAIIFAWALSYMIISYFYSNWRLKYDIKMAEADSHTTAVLADTVTNQNNVELFTHYKEEVNNFDAVTEDQRKITVKSWNIHMGLDAIQGFFSIVIEFAVLYFAIVYWQMGFLTVGSFVLIQLYIVGLSGQLWGFARIIRDFYEGYADSKEMIEIMKLPYEIKDTPTAKDVVVSEGNILFENVNFSFNETRSVLSNLNVSIKAGEKVALVGASGAGKTTFVRLLLRFYDVTSGHIKIDGNNIQHIKLDSLRKNISLVPQDPLLFHRTIKENIRYGKADATDAEVEEAAKLAHCNEFIDDLPNKYDTYVGERGIKLSGGERQRVAIARAILKNSPILILDEATSSLDSHSESLIQDALDTLMKGKTTIVIAHRLSTIRKMDRIIVMQDGSVLEQGSHELLIKKEGSLYRKLWDLQAGGFIK
jgi:ATP-binding cassette subfamily B protein